MCRTFNYLAVSCTKQGLLQAASERGFSVSERQLANWHRLGLLPKPRRQSLGRGRGMRSIYPEVTIDQLLKLLEFKKIERRPACLAWHLWWEGYEIPMFYIRTFVQLVAFLYRQDIWTSEVTNTGGDLDPRTMARPRNDVIALMRRRVGRKNDPIVTRIALEIGSGRFDGFKNDQYEEDEIWRKVTGIDLQFKVLDTLEPVLCDTAKRAIKFASRPIDDFSDGDFMAARDRLLKVRSTFPELKKATDILVPRNIPRNREAQALSLWYAMYRSAESREQHVPSVMFG